MAYVSQEMLTNVTTLTIMNEDLHVFIPQDLNPLGQSMSTPSLPSIKHFSKLEVD